MIKAYKKLIPLLMLLLITSSCGLMDRTSSLEQMDYSGNGWSDSPLVEGDSTFVPGKDFPVMSGDTGEAFRSKEEIQMRTPVSARGQMHYRQQVSLKKELLAREEALQSEGEFQVEQYRKAKKFLPSDSDKLYYLNLRNEDRESYINTRREDNFENRASDNNLTGNYSSKNPTLYLGMEKNQVLESWGRPSKIEVAGDPKLQNERWSFIEKNKSKEVYFENGRVQGWAL